VQINFHLSISQQPGLVPKLGTNRLAPQLHIVHIDLMPSAPSSQSFGANLGTTDRSPTIPRLGSRGTELPSYLDHPL